MNYKNIYDLLKDIFIYINVPKNYKFDDNYENKDGKIILHGSFFGKTKYACDIDLTTHINIDNNENKILKSFNKLGYRIEKNNRIHLKTFLAGINSKYYVNIGKIDCNGDIIGYNYNIIVKRLDEMALDKKTYAKIMKFVKEDINYYDFFKLEEKIKNMYEIRFTLDDIKHKNIMFNSEIYYEVILNYDKLKYIQASNFVFFFKNGKIVNINEDDKCGLVREIFYYYYHEINYYKSLKRLYSLLGCIMFTENKSNKKNIYSIRLNIRKFLNSKVCSIKQLLNDIEMNMYLLDNNIITIDESKLILSDNINHIKKLNLENLMNIDDELIYKKVMKKVNDFLIEKLNKISYPILMKYLKISNKFLPFDYKKITK